MLGPKSRPSQLPAPTGTASAQEPENKAMTALSKARRPASRPHHNGPEYSQKVRHTATAAVRGNNNSSTNSSNNTTPTSTAVATATTSHYKSFADLSLESGRTTDASISSIKDQTSSSVPPLIPETTLQRGTARSPSSKASLAQSGATKRQSLSLQSGKRRGGEGSSTTTSTTPTKVVQADLGMNGKHHQTSRGNRATSSSLPSSIPTATSTTNNNTSAFKPSIPPTPVVSMARFDTRAAAASEFGGSLLARARRNSEMSLLQKREELKRDLLLNDPKSPYLKELLKEDGEQVDSSSGEEQQDGTEEEDDDEEEALQENDHGSKSKDTSQRSGSPSKSRGRTVRAAPSPTAPPLTNGRRSQSGKKSRDAAPGSLETMPTGSDSRPIPESQQQQQQQHATRADIKDLTHENYSQEYRVIRRHVGTHSSSSSPHDDCLSIWRDRHGLAEQKGMEQLRALEQDVDQHILAAQARNLQLTLIKEWILQGGSLGAQVAGEHEESEDDEEEGGTNDQEEKDQLTMVDDDDKARIEELEMMLAVAESKLAQAAEEQKADKMAMEGQLEKMREQRDKCQDELADYERLAAEMMEETLSRLDPDMRRRVLQFRASSSSSSSLSSSFSVSDTKPIEKDAMSSVYRKALDHLREQIDRQIEESVEQSQRAEKAEAQLKEAQQGRAEEQQARQRLEARMRELEEQVAQQQEELELLRDAAETREAKVAEQQQQLEQSAKSLDRATATQTKVEAERLELATKVEEHARDKAERDEAFQQQKERIDQLEQQVREAQKEAQEAQKQAQEAQKQAQGVVSDLEAELQHVETDNRGLEAQLETLEQQLERERRQAASLQQELAQRERQDQQSQSTKKEQHQQHQQLKSMTEKLNVLDKRVMEMDSMLEQVRHWLTDLRELVRDGENDGEAEYDEEEEQDDKKPGATAGSHGEGGRTRASRRRRSESQDSTQSPTPLTQKTLDQEFEYLHRKIRQLKQGRDAHVQQLEEEVQIQHGQLIGKEKKQSDLERQLSEARDQLDQVRRQHRQEMLDQQRHQEQRLREMEGEVARLEQEGRRLELELLRKDETLADMDRRLHEALDRLRRQDDRAASLEADFAKTKAQLSAQIRQERNRASALARDLDVTKATLETTESTLRALENLTKKEKRLRRRQQQQQQQHLHEQQDGGSGTESLSASVSYMCSLCEASMVSSAEHSSDEHSSQGELEKTVAQKQKQRRREQQQQQQQQQQHLRREVKALEKKVVQLEKQIVSLEDELDRVEQERRTLQQELDASAENVQLLSDRIQDQAEGARSMHAKKTERIKHLEEENVRLRQVLLIQEGNLYACHSKVEALKMDRAKLKLELREREKQDRLLAVDKEGRQLPPPSPQSHPQSRPQQQHEKSKLQGKLPSSTATQDKAPKVEN